jgi:hypothetical protein
MLGLSGRQMDGMSATASIGGWIRGLAVPHCFGSEVWVGNTEGHEIRVVIRGLRRAQLYVDGNCVDQRSPLLPTKGTVPLLSSSIPSPRHGATIVEVFSKARLAARLEVRVSGKPLTMSVCNYAA